MNTTDIRRLWIDFFAERGHRHVPSSSLIPPPEERTLLFTNAGMDQMKPYFMGLSEPPARRMTSIQKCFRTSDIEEVGDNSPLHLLRDAGQLQRRRLLQGRGHPLGLGAADGARSRRAWASRRTASGPRSSWTTTRRTTSGAASASRRSASSASTSPRTTGS